MRLIDADKLKDELKMLPIMSNWGEVFIPLLIDKQPTAYDIDKVVERLEGEIEFVVREYPLHGRYIKKSRAIEIVKGGDE